MRLLTILFASALSIPAFAQKTPVQTIARVSFKDASKHHVFLLSSETSPDKTPVFKLSFQENRKKPKTKIISRSQADLIRDQSTRIIWNSEYRKPANVQQCTEYLNISSGDEKSVVCLENKRATGMSYGLLNSMRRIFQ